MSCYVGKTPASGMDLRIGSARRVRHVLAWSFTLAFIPENSLCNSSMTPHLHFQPAGEKMMNRVSNFKTASLSPESRKNFPMSRRAHSLLTGSANETAHRMAVIRNK